MSAGKVLEILFNFMSAHRSIFLDLPKSLYFSSTDAEKFLAELATHREISTHELKIMSQKDRKILYELMNQCVAYCTLHPNAEFPEGILSGSSTSTLGSKLLAFLSATGFPYPDVTRDQPH